MSALRSALSQLIKHQDLTPSEITAAMTAILQGQASAAEMAAFLTALSMKGETANEISASLKVLKTFMQPAPIAPHAHLVDIVGTGGDGANLFNISTVAAFVIAAAGGKVAKHGNRAATSSSGSADVLLAAGAHLELTPLQTALCVEKIGLGFLFAPLYHPALKQVRDVRSTLGRRSIFNLLGPLANPAPVKQQLIGVNDKKWLRMFAQVLQESGSTHALIVHAEDGLDEISCAGTTDVAELKHDKITEYQIKPEDFGFMRQPITGLVIHNAEQSLEILYSVLANQSGPARDIVALNAGAALYCAGCTASIAAGVQLALQVLENGSAQQKFDDFVRLTQTFTPSFY